MFICLARTHLVTCTLGSLIHIKFILVTVQVKMSNVLHMSLKGNENIVVGISVPLL